MAPKDFHHPFQPYEIQQQFMSAVYDCIEDGKVGIFESPTGTGKSLSLICGSLTWLREHKRKAFDDSIAAVKGDDDDEPEWMLEHAKAEKKRAALRLRADLEARLAAVREKEKKVKDRRQDNGEPLQKRRKRIDQDEDPAEAEEERFVLDDYESDSENRPSKSNDFEYSSETLKLMEKLGMTAAKTGETADEAEEELKVLFCSRTHSQLSQFVRELQRVKLPPGLPPEGPEDIYEDLKHLTLGSRKNLCINPKVAKLSNSTAINERCLELQQSAAEHKCSYLPNKENEDLVLDFRDHALAKIRDIEDLAEVGQKLGICPYYASRPAIAPTEILTVPYPLLLQKSAREALSINLKNHVVIIDEAHNLMDAVAGIYSVEVSETQLKRAKAQLAVYLQKFRNRLKGKNRVYVTQIVRLIDSLVSYLQQRSGATGIADLRDILAGKGVDQINLNKLCHYLQESKLARKVEGYTSFLETQSPEQDSSLASRPRTAKLAQSSATVSTTPTLTHLQSFFLCLMNPSAEGRFFWCSEPNTRILRYMLLDPSEHFREIVEDARAVILAGGTMSPMDDYMQQLFPYLPASKIMTLSCGHVIPPENLFVRAVPGGLDGEFDFTYAKRDWMFDRLGEALLRVVSAVRSGGIIVFFPSYDYLAKVVAAWKTPATSPPASANKSSKPTVSETLWDRLTRLLPTFSDTNDPTKSHEDIFQTYSTALTSPPSSTRSALLLSVIGGRLSEGINFSDELGRCVIVIGLPYPNLQTPEWKAKLKYLEDKAVARGEARGKAGREHAENVCMRAVNQAIGRVVRHRRDWASILLFDGRYSRAGIWGKLPGWIRGSLPEDGKKGGERFGEVVDELSIFCERRRSGGGKTL